MPTSRKSQDAARAYLKKKGKGAPARTPSSSERLDKLESSSGGAGTPSSSPGPRSGKGIGWRQLAGNPDKTLLASETVCVVSLVAYDMLGTPGQKMPRPGPPVTALAFYALLAMVGSLSDGAGSVVAAVGGLLALTVLVTGKRGQGLLGLLNKLTSSVGLGPTPTTQSG